MGERPIFFFPKQDIFSYKTLQISRCQSFWGAVICLSEALLCSAMHTHKIIIYTTSWYDFFFFSGNFGCSCKPSLLACAPLGSVPFSHIIVAYQDYATLRRLLNSNSHLEPLVCSVAQRHLTITVCNFLIVWYTKFITILPSFSWQCAYALEFVDTTSKLGLLEVIGEYLCITRTTSASQLSCYPPT